VFAVGEGEIQYFDRFGNAITSIGEEQKESGNAVRCSADLVMPLLRTYSEAAVGAPLAYWGSCGLLEIGVREGTAQELLHLHIGQRVRLVKR
jgi:S-adenosylmethionine hydrolase